MSVRITTGWNKIDVRKDVDYIWINLLSKNERKEMEKKKTSESEEGVHFIYVVMIVIAEAEKGKSRKKAHLNFQEPAANCITGTQKVSHGKKIFFLNVFIWLSNLGSCSWELRCFIWDLCCFIWDLFLWPEDSPVVEQGLSCSSSRRILVLQPGIEFCTARQILNH